jgi:hypothetical protein
MRTFPKSLATFRQIVDERGERNLSLINIMKLAHALAVRPARLIETMQSIVST